MKRKIIKISELIARVNHLNKESTCEPTVREGWNALLEDVLHLTDTYSGFNYLTQNDVPEGQEPGSLIVGGYKLFPDETRRHYY